MGGSAPNADQMRWFCLFGVFSCHFGKTPEQIEEISIRHLRMLLLDEVPTNRSGIGPVVEGQEEQQSFDATDGPSKFTDPAVSPATDLQIG